MLDTPAHREAFAVESALAASTFMRWVAPILVLVHLYYARMPAPTDFDALHLEWFAGVRAIHSAAIPVALGLGAAAWLRPRWPWLGDATTVSYLLIASLIAANAQRVGSVLQAFLVIALALAVVGRARPVVFLGSLAVGAGLVGSAIGVWHADPSTRIANAPNLVVYSLLIAFSYVVVHRTRLAEAGSRYALADVNQSLEQRVEEQVREIRARSTEVEALNVQLAARVKDRSRELSIALGRLAERDGDAVLAAGSRLGDRVVIDRVVGHGGMGVVYSARDLATDAPVAVKVIKRVHPEALHGFLQEASTGASVQHPAIVRTLHVDVSDDGTLFQVMELVEGTTLEGRLAADGALPDTEVARIGSVLAEGLAAAHAVGIVHRDVKPSNVMLTPVAPGVKLLDFGISQVERGALRGESRDRIRGTPAYMAPEQFAGGDVTDRADVYALGLVLYQAASGKLPFEADTPVGWRQAHAHAVPIALEGALGAAIEACLAKAPSERPSASDLAAALSAFASTGNPEQLARLAAATPRGEASSQETWA